MLNTWKILPQRLKNHGKGRSGGTSWDKNKESQHTETYAIMAYTVIKVNHVFNAILSSCQSKAENTSSCNVHVAQKIKQVLITWEVTVLGGNQT